MTDLYQTFLHNKAQQGQGQGFDPAWMPHFLYDFQSHLVEWTLHRGKAAIFADCGLGKTPMQLVWAENIVRKTNRPVLILTPLAVSYQLVREAEKFGISCSRASDRIADNGIATPRGNRIITTNYEQLEKLNPDDFAGVVCDESSILKNFNGARRRAITEFMRTIQYRLLCTATAAPNDYIELGTSSESIGDLGYVDMLARFFKNTNHTSNVRDRMYGAVAKWRFRGHAELPFWRWVSSWSRSARLPQDLGFDDSRFALPPLCEQQHIVEARTKAPGMLFDLPAIGMHQQREEQRRTIQERCECAARLVSEKEQAIVWCNLNAEGDLLEDIIPGARQVKGSQPDHIKEETLLAFADGEVRVLVTKPKIGAWGLNLQACSHVIFFPSYSYEQYYQAVRRCWRFGQKNPVMVDIVTTEGGCDTMRTLQRKARQADKMFDRLVAHSKNALGVTTHNEYADKVEVPSWL